ncbi:MAG: hypothetical protein EA404_13265 [Spirochaetaceae bacterium]|nr:MAG: hypothetical protein EA404_13265 [Spirochaetaceae bacterium]
MTTSQFPVLLIAIPLMLVPVAFFVSQAKLSVRGFAIASLGLVAMLAYAPLVAALGFGLVLPLEARMGGWGPELGIVLMLDPLAALLLPITNTIIVLGAAIGFPAGERTPIPYFPLWFLLAAGSNGLIVTSDLFNAYVFLEIIAICSHALVAYRGDGYAFESAFKYLIAGLIGSAFILWGIIALFAATGALSLSVIVDRLPGAPPALVAAGFSLIVAGICVKLAIVPFHSWKPDGLTGAPPSSAGAISGVVLSAVLVLMLRVLVGLGGIGGPAQTLSAVSPFPVILTFLGAVSVVVGHSMALVQGRLTRMLAYSSIGHFGAMLLALALVTPAATAAVVFHGANHAVLKSGLFFLCAAAATERGTDRITGLSGYLARRPLELAACAILMLALVGLPPTVGFASKWAMIVEVVRAGGIVRALLIGGGSVIAVVYYLRALHTMIWDGAPRQLPDLGDPRARVTRLALVVGAGYTLVGFVGAGFIFAVASSAVSVLLGGPQ